MSTINNKISFGVVRDIRNDAFDKLEELPLSYVDKKAHGDIVSRVINDADQFAEGLLLGFTQLFTGVLTIIGTLAFMIYMNWIIAAVVFLLTPLSLFIARFITKRTYSMFRERSECEGEATAYINEIVYFFPDFESVCCSMFSSNCCLLSCIQISQEAGKMVWDSHLF